ncbi:Vgb family protein [Nitrosopumilus sp. S6]
MIKYWGFFLVFAIIFSFLSPSNVFAQEISLDEFVTYSKQSSFIKEIPFPVKEFGLRGITIDNNENVWIYHATQNTSLISKFEPLTEEFTKFEITKPTTTNNAIVNLSGGHIIYDELRNIIWFTDARTNSIGKFTIKNEQMDMISVPTENSGPMGIILSPDNSKIWFTELNSDKFASLDIDTNKIQEFSIDENSGPTFLAFDESGSLWVTLSYSNSILKVDLTGIDSIPSITKVSLPKPDFFSPFGIAIFKDSLGTEKIVLSDHGSSRVIVSELNSNLQDYVSLWTSPTKLYPQTLPSQIDVDESGDIYFAQHGGNKISKIDKTGIITEYEVPTGPLSTVIYLDVSNDGKKVWFTEVLGNKIGYLDTTIQIPFDLEVNTNKVIFTETKHSEQITAKINRFNDDRNFLSFDNIHVSLVGMTHSGLDGISFTSNPDIINLNQVDNAELTLDIFIDDNIESGTYHTMLQISALETIDDSMKISKLYPLTLVMDLPSSTFPSTNVVQNTEVDSRFSITGLIKNAAIVTIVILLALFVYDRIKVYRQKNTPDTN